MKKLVYPKIRFLQKTAVLLLTSDRLSDSRRYCLQAHSTHLWFSLSLFHTCLFQPNWKMHFVLFMYGQIRFSFLFKVLKCTLQKYNQVYLNVSIKKKKNRTYKINPFCLYKQVDMHLNRTQKCGYLLYMFPCHVLLSLLLSGESLKCFWSPQHEMS